MKGFQGITAFVYAVKHNSYAQAARVLGLSPSAIAKSISKLEDELGTRLFHRTTRSISLTENGFLFYERCCLILDELYSAKEIISSNMCTPRGALHITAPHIFGHKLLMPLISKFNLLYPEIHLDIDFEDHVVDIIKEGIDIAIRSGNPVDSRLVSRYIGKQHFVVCGSYSYLDRYGAPQIPSELSEHSCIHFKYPSNGKIAPWSFIPPYKNITLPQNFIFNNTYAGLYAAVNGLGLAHLPIYVAHDALESRELYPVLTEFMAPFGDLMIMWPTNRQLSPKVRAFTDFLINEMKQQKQAFKPYNERQSPHPGRGDCQIYGEGNQHRKQ